MTFIICKLKLLKNTIIYIYIYLLSLLLFYLNKNIRRNIIKKNLIYMFIFLLLLLFIYLFIKKIL